MSGGERERRGSWRFKVSSLSLSSIDKPNLSRREADEMNEWDDGELKNKIKCKAVK
jgi:hypothetical protein